MTDDPTRQPADISSRPGPSDEVRTEQRATLARRVRVDLRKAVWEASQVMSYDEISGYVEAVIGEIETDEP